LIQPELLALARDPSSYVEHLDGSLPPTGIDVHQPDWFERVDDVIYLHNLLDPTRLRESVIRAWPAVAGMKSRLTILNGAWSVARELEADVLQLAVRRHLIVTDHGRSKPEEMPRPAATPTHILTVSEEKENRIRVLVQRV
jgi:hypothetical protein